MRSPAQPHHQPRLSSALRSHSPLSPKSRNVGSKPTAADEGEMTPAKELELLVNQVKCDLKHFCDVITKKKLEMLPGNGTIVLETIGSIHTAIKPYCGRSMALSKAVTRLCTALACLIRLCDEATTEKAAGAGEEALQPERVESVVEGVRRAVADVTALALQHMVRPALSPRPALVSPRAPAQRNSLPDIPLTPKEISLLTGETGSEGGGVRASHSSESVLDAPDPPPPKPPRPHRKIDLAPPLPPKRKPVNDSSLLGISTDRVSLQSHSSGSLDSMLNVSNEDDSRTIAERVAMLDDSFGTQPSFEIIGVCSCAGSEGRMSLDSSGHSDAPVGGAHAHTNHNRFSSESGFASMNQNSVLWSECGKLTLGHAELTSDTVGASYAHHYASNSNNVFESTDGVTELTCRSQSFERRMNVINSVSSLHSMDTKCGAMLRGAGEEGEMPPALPAKTRRTRADVQQHFPTVEIRQTSTCALHGDIRPHTLADHQPPRPPPLPLKKKHIMAYMEMFGNCSHPPNPNNAPTELFRHSIHTYNLASGQQATAVGAGGAVMQRHTHVQQRTIAQSLTLHHFTTPPLSGSEDNMSVTTLSGGTSPIPPEPPALPPKLNKTKQLQSTAMELLPPPSPRPTSHSSTSTCDDSFLNSVEVEEILVPSPGPGKFPLEEELERLVHPGPPASPAPALTPSPLPSPALSQRSEGAVTVTAPESIQENGQKTEGSETGEESTEGEENVMLQTDVSAWLLFKTPTEDGPDVRGGHPDALVVLATKATKDFAYQEAFLTTYRTWLSPSGLVARLVRRARHLQSRPHDLRPTLALLTRVIADLTTGDLDGPLLHEIMEFVYWLVGAEELPIAKALRLILLEKQKQLHTLAMGGGTWEGYGYTVAGGISLRSDTLLDFKASELAEQMTLLDAALFSRITTAEVLSWPRDQSEESSPNLTRFTEHFNKMSYWARSRILKLEEARERERYATKLLKVMKALRKINNFNSYLALLSALDSAPVRRLGWPRAVQEALIDHCKLIDSTSSFRAYRQALGDTHPPCIPYIGLVLQDLTFVHIGNPDYLPDSSVNFSKRWQQYHIMENMKRFHKGQYTFRKNERIIAMFNGFDDVLSEEALWQISEAIKPRGGGQAKTLTPPLAPAPTPAPQPAA